MNKRQRNKAERKLPKTLPPWAGGRFSRSSEERGEEVYVIHVVRPGTNIPEQVITEELVMPYSEDAADSAIMHCKALVDTFIAATYQSGLTPEDLFASYQKQGPDPYIMYEERGMLGSFCSSIPFAFNAWGYAASACRTLCGQEQGELSRSLVLWQGRYLEYDRTRMMSQLLLLRRVRLTRECSGMIGAFPAGTEGTVGIHAYYIGASTFDWRIEVPVIFDVADERCQVTFGIPYDALEFVESDEAYIQNMKKYRL